MTVNAAVALPNPYTAMPARQAPAADRLSDSIAIARVICILGVVYVHAWTGVDAQALYAMHGSGQDMLRWVLMEGLGRSAVPLLGLISGWLLIGSSKSRNWWPHVRHKARTILLPMVLWNALAILIVSGSAALFKLPAPVPHTAEWVMQELFILTRNPDISVQMPFLRDLFLCMLVAPLLVRAPTWALGIVSLAAAACWIAGIGQPVLMRTSILAFFTLGMVVRRIRLERKIANMSFGLALLPFLLLLPVKVALSLYDVPFWDNQGHPMAAVDMVTRVAAAILFWRVAWGLANSFAAPALKRIEPYMFLMFCGHLILIWTLAPIIGRLTGPLGSPAYPAFLLLQPFLTLAFAIAFAKLLAAVSPSATRILSGGRLGRDLLATDRPDSIHRDGKRVLPRIMVEHTA